MTYSKNGKKIGAPTMYTEELGDLICSRVATHPIGLEHICKMYDDMPTALTIREWRHKHKSFASKYLEAKSEQAILMVEEIDDLLDHKVLYITDANGQLKMDSASASMAIARCNNRKWQAARLAPRVFGDHLETNINNTELLQDSLQRKAELDEQNKKEC